jgi:nucleoside-diphosphate-sugar epimerase
LQQGELSRGIFRRGAHLKIMDANGVQGIEADLMDHHTLHEAMEGVDTVYSMASAMPYGDSDFARVNSEGIRNLLEAAGEMKVKAFIHLSTLDVFGFRIRMINRESQPAPSGAYQESKLEADRLVMEFGQRSNEVSRVVVVRPARAVGSRDRTLTVPLLQMIASGKVTLPMSGSAISFTHPRDVAQAMYKAATTAGPGGKVYLVKSFDASAEELAKALAGTLNASADVKKEGVLSKSLLPRYTSEQLKASLHIDPQDDWGELSFSPEYNLQKTVEEITQWYRKEPWVTEEPPA